MKMLMPVVIAAFLVGQQPANQSDQPQNPQKLVAPGEYRKTPPKVRVSLEQRHCQLPETKNYDDGHPLNVVSGHFARADQTDWAALCIIKDRARVVVLWGGKVSCSNEIHSGWPLEHAFSREPAGGLFLMPVGRKEILAYRKFFGDDHTNDINHEGIEVGDEQASLIYYCDGRNWLELQGND
jgi:hypothetical protein